jgi:ribosomal protein L11 methyltransferase
MKKLKPLWRIAITTTLEAEDAVGEMLGTLFGVAVSSYFDLEKRTSIVSAFLEQGKFSAAQAKPAITAGLHRIVECGLHTGPGTVGISRVKREDWAESWKRHFHPLEVGKKLLVKPSWSRQRAAKGQAEVILDPGLSFGTGQHPTTSFCLNEIVRCRRPEIRQSFLDIGTGSGILAIAAAKLGYTPVQAFDFDPEAVRIARENAQKNHVFDLVKPVRRDVTRLPLKSTRQFDLVCANLISNLLIAEKQRILNRLKPDGTLVLAGILATEFGEIERTFNRLKLNCVSRKVENEWCSGAFCFV